MKKVVLCKTVNESKNKTKKGRYHGIAFKTAQEIIKSECKVFTKCFFFHFTASSLISFLIRGFTHQLSSAAFKKKLLSVCFLLPVTQRIYFHCIKLFVNYVHRVIVV